jgi:hypothetical protein
MNAENVGYDMQDMDSARRNKAEFLEAINSSRAGDHA